MRRKRGRRNLKRVSTVQYIKYREGRRRAGRGRRVEDTYSTDLESSEEPESSSSEEESEEEEDQEKPKEGKYCTIHHMVP